MTNQDDFVKRLLATFRVEAGEHLEALSSALLSMESATGEERGELLERVFREAHSLKGAARAVGFPGVESLCHSLETLFAGWRSGRVAGGQALFDLLHECLDLLAVLVAAERPDGGADPRVGTLIRRLESAPAALPAAAAGAGPSERRPSAAGDGVTRAVEDAGAQRVAVAGTIRIPISKIDAIMHQTEDLLGPRLAAAQRVVELREARAALVAWKREGETLKWSRNSVAHELDRARGCAPGADPQWDAVAKLLDHADAEDHFLAQLEKRMARLEQTARSDHHALSGLVHGLLRDVKQTHMLPFSSVAEGLRKMARDLGREGEKRVEVAIHGEEIEIDRQIMEEMKAPLQHLLRNAVDHGIEKPARREQEGKPPQGTVSIAVAQKDGRIEVAIEDDGAGIDLARVRAAAVRLGIVGADRIDLLDDQDARTLIFHSGLSTSPMVTELSGTGLGLAIVREKVDRLGGTIAVEGRAGGGTVIRVGLPLTLATLRGVLVLLGDQRFVVPSASIERVTRVSRGMIQTAENRETIPLDGRPVSLVWLADVLELPGPRDASKELISVIVLGAGAGRIAFRVDAVLAEQEVLIKSLGPQLARVRNIAGASVLGTGEVVPVLNVPDLMSSAVRSPAAAPSMPAESFAGPERKRILVVEDSITSRTLLKSILEAAGYDVAVALDGLDAWSALRTRPFELIVSDVEMPRMDGFELTARVRGEASLSEIPVVLVTALESREHRERGIDVGANAYIVKSSFDQSNLLEVVRRLI